MRDHMRAQAMRIWHWSNKMAPSFNWEIGTGTENGEEQNGGEHNGETPNDETVNKQHAQQEEPPVLPPIRRVSSEEEHGIELRPLSKASSSR